MIANLNQYPNLKAVASKLGVDPFWLWITIQHESGWNPRAYNPSGGASGLIQIMPDTARGMGISTEAIRTMDANTQLASIVYPYLAKYKGKMKDIADVYLAVFYPTAIGKSDNYILGSEKGMKYAGLVAQENPANNPDHNNVITKGEVKKVITDQAKKFGYSPFQSFISRIFKKL